MKRVTAKLHRFAIQFSKETFPRLASEKSDPNNLQFLKLTLCIIPSLKFALDRSQFSKITSVKSIFLKETSMNFAFLKITLDTTDFSTTSLSITVSAIIQFDKYGSSS